MRTLHQGFCAAGTLISGSFSEAAILKIMLAAVLAVTLVGSARAEILPLPAEGETFWGLGNTGIVCDADPCPRHGVFSMFRDGTRGRPPSSFDKLEPPLLRADEVVRRHIETAFSEDRCVVAEGHFEGEILVVRRLLGDCLPVSDAALSGFSAGNVHIAAHSPLLNAVPGQDWSRVARQLSGNRRLPY